MWASAARCAPRSDRPAALLACRQSDFAATWSDYRWTCHFDGTAFASCATGGCDLGQLAGRVSALGRARPERLPHLPLRAWVDFTCAATAPCPPGTDAARIYPQTPSYN